MGFYGNLVDTLESAEELLSLERSEVNALSKSEKYAFLEALSIILDIAQSYENLSDGEDIDLYFE